jgi:predicted ABC-type ATPase
MVKSTNSKKQMAADLSEAPDVERHDEIYFRHASGPKTGKVLSRGAHGCVIEADGSRHKVRWENFLGHKVRVRPDVRVVDKGEDGFLVESRAGERRFVRDPMGEVKADGPAMRKALRPTVLFFAEPEVLAKAMGRGIKNRPGLSLQDVTDKSGRHTKRWKRSGGDAGGADGDDGEAGAEHGYGTHNLRPGDHVQFEAGDFSGEGEIVGAPGRDGAYVRDKSGRDHRVLWSEVRAHRPQPGAAGPKAEHEVRGSQDPIEPDKFSAADYARSHDDDKVTPESVLSHFPPDTGEKIHAAQDRLATLEETYKTHRLTGEGEDSIYADSRAPVHASVLFEPWTDPKGKTHPGILSPEEVERATPKDGEQPTFMLLGGRGGSGKSKLKGRVYDPSKYLVLDADEFKQRLPEYEGWNAGQVHEESSDLLERALSFAKLHGLNVVLDATMKTSKGAMKKVDAFKEAGYRIEAHYMHLPRQEAAKRAVSRFLGATQRYVPVDVVLGNTSNEQTFDEVRKHADAWSFHDNNVGEKDEPKLISKGEQSAAVAAGRRHRS